MTGSPNSTDGRSAAARAGLVNGRSSDRVTGDEPQAGAGFGSRPVGDPMGAVSADSGMEQGADSGNGQGTDSATETGAEPGGLFAGRDPRLLIATAVTAVVTLLGGVVAVLATGDDGGERAKGGRGSGSAGDVAPPTVTNVTTGRGVRAPLRRIVPPDMLAVAGASVTPAKAKRIAGLARVQDTMILSAGAVQLQGRQVNAFAVEPAAFRSWTPPSTARNQELWAALADDGFVVSATAANSLGLRTGGLYPIVGRSMPQLTLGGSGQLGLPGVDMLVNRKIGKEMGLVPNLAVLINAPGADLTKLSKAVRKILGSRAQVLDLHDRGNQTGGTGGASSYLELYKDAARTCPGLSWTVLAAIGQIESGHGRNTGPSSAGALGPMQFMPATWKAYGVDGDGDNRADIMNPYDAVPGAAKYLCLNGAGQGGRKLYTAIWHYNHADWYVRKVLALARSYAVAYS